MRISYLHQFSLKFIRFVIMKKQRFTPIIRATNLNKMKFLIFKILLFSCSNLHSQTNNSVIENTLLIAENNKSQLENVVQLLVVYNEKPENFTAVFVALEKKATKTLMKNGNVILILVGFR